MKFSELLIGWCIYLSSYFIFPLFVTSLDVLGFHKTLLRVYSYYLISKSFIFFFTLEQVIHCFPFFSLISQLVTGRLLSISCADYPRPFRSPLYLRLYLFWWGKRGSVGSRSHSPGQSSGNGRRKVFASSILFLE